MVFDYANYIMTNNIEYSEIIPDAEFISDTKYRLVLDSVFYYNDSVLAYKTSNNALNQFIRNNYPERLDNFAVHMNLAYRGQIAGYSSGISSLLQSVILINCKVGRYTGLWATAQLLIHEIGHNLGLDHPYNTEENNITHPEFLWDMFGKTQQPWCDEPDTNEVCYHDWGWDCEVSDTTIHVLTILWEGVNMADIILHFNVEEYIEHYVLQISESTHMDIQIFLL